MVGKGLDWVQVLNMHACTVLFTLLPGLRGVLAIKIGPPEAKRLVAMHTSSAHRGVLGDDLSACDRCGRGLGSGAGG